MSKRAIVMTAGVNAPVLQEKDWLRVSSLLV